MEALSYISKGILLLSIYVHFFYLYKKGVPYRLFSFYLVFIFVVDTGFHILRNLYIENIFLSHYYFAGQAVLLNVFYYRLLLSGRLKRIQLVISIILSVALLMNMTLLHHDKHAFDLFEVVACNFSVVVCMLLYLYDHIDKHKIYYLSTAALLAYTIASTIIFISFNLLISINSPANTKNIWLLNIILFVLLQLAILYDAVKLSGKRMLWATK